MQDKYIFIAMFQYQNSTKSKTIKETKYMNSRLCITWQQIHMEII